MSWEDRLREAAYTSPSGVRLTFGFENVQKSIEKKTTGFEFPDADGTYVQDLGHSGRKYPLRMFFWGEDYDLEVKAFEDALIERGVGRLEHPVYGTINVVPFGAITRRDDLTTAANQAVLQVTFWETIEVIYPSAQGDPASGVITSVDEYNDAFATEFDQVIDLDSAVDEAVFKNTYQRGFDAMKKGLQKVSDTVAAVKKRFDAISKSINQGLDLLVGQPLTLAAQTIQIIQTPARALTSIEARLDAYGNLLDDLLGVEDGTSNDFHTADLFASTYITGSILSVVNNQFDTKSGAIEAADIILAQMEDLTNWRDDNFASLEEIDIGGSYQQLQEAVAITVGFLVQISFTLKQERRIVLNSPRSIVDLTAELYGSVDDQLDILINTNDLSGSEILELPKGKEIVYYI